MNLKEQVVNAITIALLLGLLLAGFMVMDSTAESNKVTADIAVIQAKHKKTVLIQVGLLTAEMKNLQKDMEHIRERVEKLNSSLSPPSKKGN